jgi:hypothetical protein
VLWYLLASSRGGETRARILRAVDERPRNATQLADDLDFDYTTIRHHLDILVENNTVGKSADEYAAVYMLNDRDRANWSTAEEIHGQGANDVWWLLRPDGSLVKPDGGDGDGGGSDDGGTDDGGYGDEN